MARVASRSGDNEGVTSLDLLDRARFARDAATRAAAIVRPMQAGIKAREKVDGSGPVTEADLASERSILAELLEHYPDEPIVSEETRAAPQIASGPVWCVDPLDGTREYSQGRHDYAVMIGLLVNGQPAAGAVALPGDDLVVWGAIGHGAFVGDTPITLEPVTRLEDATVIHSRSHVSIRLAGIIERLAPKKTVAAGSAGYKAAQLLTGVAHVYIHPNRGTMWWDSVAPAAIVLAAGGMFTDAQCEPIRYDGDLEHRFGLLFAVPGLEPALEERLG